MSAKSLGALPVVYAAGKLQNPLPRGATSYKSDTNSTGLRNNVSPKKLGLQLSIQHCIKGRGPTIAISALKVGWGWKILNSVWVSLGLLVDIVGLELGSLHKKCIASN